LGALEWGNGGKIWGLFPPTKERNGFLEWGKFFKNLRKGERFLRQNMVPGKWALLGGW